MRARPDRRQPGFAGGCDAPIGLVFKQENVWPQFVAQITNDIVLFGLPIWRAAGRP